VQSWELLRDAIERVGVKRIAARLNVSTALVYKWCQEPPSNDSPDASGARNPLDRVCVLYELTRDERIINWLCCASGGFFVPNPSIAVRDREEELLGTTQRMVQDFGELLSDISRSIENDGVITPSEAATIRQSWERLKMQAELFVTACERGAYGKPR
jgi:hypothetical protein